MRIDDPVLTTRRHVLPDDVLEQGDLLLPRFAETINAKIAAVYAQVEREILGEAAAAGIDPTVSIDNAALIDFARKRLSRTTIAMTCAGRIISEFPFLATGSIVA